MSEPDIRVQLRSDPRYLAGVREMVLAVCRRLGFSRASASQISLAVDEALANVICHGYGRRCEGKIWIDLWPQRGPEGEPGVRIVIEDEGRQVDEECIRGRELSDVRPGGLGVHIIREIMDEVRYEKREPRGMRLTLVKHGSRRRHPAGEDTHERRE